MAPEVRLGEPFMVIETRTHRDKVKLLTDHEGRVHAVIAVSQSRKIVDLVIGQNGVEQRQVVRDNVTPEHIDAAFDKQGRLHIVSDTEHFVRGDSGWESVDDTPWKATEVEPYEVRFVPGWPDLLWVFSLNGKYVGAPGRLTLGLFGGYGGAFMLPFYGHGIKLVVAPNPFVRRFDPVAAKTDENHRNSWCLVDPATADAVSFVAAASDGRRTVYLLYVTAPNGGIAIDLNRGPEARTIRFLRLDIRFPAVERPQIHPDGTTSPEATATGSCILASAPVARLSSELYYELAFAVDGDTGESLALAANSGGAIDANDDWATTVPPPLDHYIWPHLAPAGDRRFHVLVIQQKVGWWSVKYTINYLMRTPTAWSRAIRLGNADVATWNGEIAHAIDIVEASDRKAFIVWPVPGGIKGQWIEPNMAEGVQLRQEQSRSPDDK